MDILVIRHTTPEVAPGTCYGATDLDLAPSFAEEYAKVRAGIDSHAWEKPLIYSSPLRRCRLAAERFAAEIDGENVRLDDRLREMNFGDWENRPWDSLPREQLDAWGRDYARAAPPGGESYGDVYGRAVEFWNDLRSEHDADAKIVIFSHGGPIRCILAHVLGMPASRAFRLKVDYGGRSLITLAKTDDEANYARYVNRV